MFALDVFVQSLFAATPDLCASLVFVQTRSVITDEMRTAERVVRWQLRVRRVLGRVWRVVR